MIIYIALIQLLLLINTIIIFICEHSPLWANTWKSVLIRFIIAIILLVIGNYVPLLALLPYWITFASFFLSIVTTAMLIKYVMVEYFERVRRVSRLRRRKRNED